MRSGKQVRSQETEMVRPRPVVVKDGEAGLLGCWGEDEERV